MHSSDAYHPPIASDTAFNQQRTVMSQHNGGERTIHQLEDNAPEMYLRIREAQGTETAEDGRELVPGWAAAGALFLSSSCRRATRSALFPVASRFLSWRSFRSSGTFSVEYSILVMCVVVYASGSR